MFIAPRIAKKGPKNTLFLQIQSFRKLILPSRTVANAAVPPNSMPRNSSILEKNDGDSIKTRLKKVARDEKTITNALKIISNISRYYIKNMLKR